MNPEPTRPLVDPTTVRVEIVRIDLLFSEIVLLLVKVALAAVPALLILSVFAFGAMLVFSLIGAVIGN